MACSPTCRSSITSRDGGKQILLEPHSLCRHLTATGARRSNPDQLRRSPVAQSATLHHGSTPLLGSSGAPLRYWKPNDAKNGATVRRVLRPYPTMSFGDCARNGQSHAHTVVLGCYERLE